MAAKTIENVKPADGSSGQRTATPGRCCEPHTPPANGEKPIPSARNRVQGARCSDTATLRTTVGALAPTCRFFPENNHPRCRGFAASAEIDPRPSRGGGATPQPGAAVAGWPTARIATVSIRKRSRVSGTKSWRSPDHLRQAPRPLAAVTDPHGISGHPRVGAVAVQPSIRFTTSSHFFTLACTSPQSRQLPVDRTPKRRAYCIHVIAARTRRPVLSLAGTPTRNTGTTHGHQSFCWRICAKGWFA